MGCCARSTTQACSCLFSRTAPDKPVLTIEVQNDDLDGRWFDTRPERIELIGKPVRRIKRNDAERTRPNLILHGFGKRALVYRAANTGKNVFPFDVNYDRAIHTRSP